MPSKILLRHALVLSLVGLLPGCVVSEQKFNNLQFNVRNQDNRLVNMENTLEQIASGGTTAAQTIQKRQASIADELERLSMEILQLKGQLDESRHHSRELQEENRRLQQELDNKLINLEALGQRNAAAIHELDTGITEIKATMAQEAEQRAQKALRAAQEAQARAAQAAAAAAAAAATQPSGSQTKEISPAIHKKKKDADTPAPVVKAPVAPKATTTEPSTDKSPAEKLYDMGLGQYRSKDYKGAIVTFTTFLDRHKEDKLLPDARFWLGSSLLNNGDYSGAVLEFQNIVADYPGHAKAPEALLQQAKAFEHFGDKMVQKKLYKDVLTYYPDTEQAVKAKQLLGKLQ